MELSKAFKEQLRAAMDAQFQTVVGEKPANGYSPSRVTEFLRNTTGADTIIFAFDYQYMPLKPDSSTENKLFEDNTMVTIPLILRIYGRSSLTNGFYRAEQELKLLQGLKTANLPVPQAYYAGKSPMDKAYMVMERIEGQMQSTIILEAHKKGDMALVGQMFQQFVKGMVHIHQTNLHSLAILRPKSFESLPQSSTAFSAELIKGFASKNEHFNLEELKPVVNWLNQRLKTVSDSRPVLLHGDYHPANIIVKSDQSIIIIDWADLAVGDYRMEIGFAVGVLNAVGIDLTDMLVNLYQQLSGKTIEDLDFFILLANYKNILRIYSMINNHAITGETDSSKEAMLGNYSAYSKYLLDLVVSTTGIEVPSLRKYFSGQ